MTHLPNDHAENENVGKGPTRPKSRTSKNKTVHRAFLVSQKGAVSPLCAGDKPRALNLKTATWTLRDCAVTCKQCLECIEAKKKLCDTKTNNGNKVQTS